MAARDQRTLKKNKKQRTKNNVSKENVLLKKADDLALLVYQLTRPFPKDELYGITSQIRRAVLSVPLNVVEGYARFSTKSHTHFLQIAYGSVKETRYLLYFSYKQNYLSKKDYTQTLSLADEVARMLYSKIETLKTK